MSSALDASTREALLERASEACRSVTPKVAEQAATALAILLHDGPATLERALPPSTAVGLGASAKHWEEFRRTLGTSVLDLARNRGLAQAAFFLGWLKRLATVSEVSGAALSSAGKIAGREQLEAPRVVSVKAGDSVEAILLAERTRKGGWKARHERSGLEGPITNSDAVPADAKAEDSVTLVVVSVSRREIAFRYPTQSRWC